MFILIYVLLVAFCLMRLRKSAEFAPSESPHAQMRRILQSFGLFWIWLFAYLLGAGFLLPYVLDVLSDANVSFLLEFYEWFLEVNPIWLTFDRMAIEAIDGGERLQAARYIVVGNGIMLVATFFLASHLGSLTDDMTRFVRTYPLVIKSDNWRAGRRLVYLMGFMFVLALALHALGFHIDYQTRPQSMVRSFLEYESYIGLIQVCLLVSLGIWLAGWMALFAVFALSRRTQVT